MNDRTLHDIKEILTRLELMAQLLAKKDFSYVTHSELKADLKSDLARMMVLFDRLSNDQ